MKNQSIVMFGATSGIARAMSHEFLKRGANLILVGRNEAALHAEAADLTVRYGRNCPVFVWDLLERDSHEQRFAQLSALGPLTGLVLAAGMMPSESEMEADPRLTRMTFDLNLTETVMVLNLFADAFRRKGAGFLSVLSSVAGDRGRASNKTYGATKAGLTAYLEGLRGALVPYGVLVQTVKPGPVRTPLLASYKGPAALIAEPGPVARRIVNGIVTGKTTVYAPGYWRLVMGLLGMLPEALMRKVPG